MAVEVLRCFKHSNESTNESLGGVTGVYSFFYRQKHAVDRGFFV